MSDICHPIPPANDGPPRAMKNIPLFIPAGGYGVAEYPDWWEDCREYTMEAV